MPGDEGGAVPIPRDHPDEKRELTTRTALEADSTREGTHAGVLRQRLDDALAAVGEAEDALSRALTALDAAEADHALGDGYTTPSLRAARLRVDRAELTLTGRRVEALNLARRLNSPTLFDDGEGSA